MLRALDAKEIASVSGGAGGYDSTSSMEDEFGGGGDGGIYADYYSGGDWDTTSNPTYTDPSTGDIVVTAPTYVGGYTAAGNEIASTLNGWADTLDNWSGYAGMGAMVLGGAAAAQGGLDVPNDLGAGAVGIASGALWTSSQLMKGLAHIAQP